MDKVAEAFGKFLIAFGLFWVLMLGFTAMPFDIPTAVLLPGAASLALALTFAFFVLRSPTPPQTSVDQPVRLLGLKQKFTGGITGFRLGFTNSEYKSRFDTLNQRMIAAGTLSTTLVR